MKKYLALLLTVVLVVSLFAGCGKKAGTGSETTTTTTTTTGTADSGTDEKKMDFKGVKLKAICYEQASKDNDRVSAAINEKMGFEIEWVICPASEGWAAQDRLLAADPSIDILYLSPARLSQYLSEDYLMDLTTYVGDKRFPNIQKYSIPKIQGTAAADGKYYGLPIPAIGSYATTNGYGLAIRQDMLAEAGLNMPDTIDDLDKILAAIKAKDSSKYPLYGHIDYFSLIFSRSFSKAGDGWWVDSNGQLKHYIQDPGYKDFVAKMTEWYKKGYLHPEFVSHTSANAQQLMSAEEVSVVAAWCTNPINPNVALMEKDKKKRFDFVIGALEGPAGRGLKGNPGASTFLGVNVNCKYHDAVMAYFDFCLTEEGTRLGMWGIEDVNYTVSGDTVTRATGDHAYNNQFNPYTNQMWIPAYKAGQHYTDTQYRNWYKVFFTPERLKQIYYEPDTGLVYDYSTGDNQYNELNTTAVTFIRELMINIITGKESINNWEAKVAELEKIAISQMVKERNEQWAKYNKAVYKPIDPPIDTSNSPAWIENFEW
jgi:putative aldouronate transport system substrate-binding protein